MSPGPITRRRFLATTTAAAAGTLLARTPLRASAIEKLNIAVVGVQGQGWWNITQLRNEAVNIVALCDVDADRLAKSAAEIPGAARYRDFRRMLERQKDIDAVLVATADHVHAPASAMAMRMGKHVYCEKPLAHTVYEARTLAGLARENGLATQMGTQIHARSNYRRVVELIRSGAIGPVRAAHVWCGKSWSKGRWQPAKPAPASLDWDLWLGPAPERPYCDGVHPNDWRRFWEYGGGTIGDMACHHMDLVHWALDLRHPTTVRALGPAPHPVGTPESLIVHYDHPARADRSEVRPAVRPAVRVTWYDGENRPSILAALRERDGTPVEWGDGQLFVGDRGFLISDYNRHRLFPVESYDGFEPPAPSIPDSIGHHREWIEACKTGGPTTCNFDYSGALTEAVLLGNVAFRTGRTLEWDAENLRVTNVPEAAPLIRRDYRAGWTL